MRWIAFRFSLSRKENSLIFVVIYLCPWARAYIPIVKEMKIQRIRGTERHECLLLCKGPRSSTGENLNHVHHVGSEISVGPSQVSAEAQKAYYLDLVCIEITVLVSNYSSDDSSSSLLLECSRPVTLGSICYTNHCITSLGVLGSSNNRVWICMGLLNLCSPKHWWLWAIIKANLNNEKNWVKVKIFKKMNLFGNSRELQFGVGKQ